MHRTAKSLELVKVEVYNFYIMPLSLFAQNFDNNSPFSNNLSNINSLI